MTEKPQGTRAFRDEGFALLLVLWTLGFLALIGAQTLATGRSAVRLGDRTLQRVQLETLADAAITSELFGLSTGAVRPAPQWHGGPEEESTRIVVRSQADRNRVNPNFAGQTLLAALFSASGLPTDQSQALSAAIFSWRMPDVAASGATGSIGGQKTCTPTGAPFHTFDDLSALPGMTPSVLNILKPHLSFSQIQLPDLSSTDPAVRQALTRSGISNSPDQKPYNEQPEEETLIGVDAVATRGAYRMNRHAEVVLLPDARPVPWRVVRWETTTRHED